MPTAIYHARLGNLPKESRLNGSYKRTGLIMDQALLSFVELTADYVWAEGAQPDQHPFDQMMYIIEGRLEMVLNKDESYRLEQGDALYIPGNVPHRANLINKERCYLVEIFAPIRTDYLHIAEHQTASRAAPRKEDGSRDDLRSWAQSFTRPYLKNR